MPQPRLQGARLTGPLLDSTLSGSYVEPIAARLGCESHSKDKGDGMATVKVTDASFSQDVLQSSEPVVVDFWAEWCGPCRMIGPALEEISNEMAGKVKIVKLNVDENPQVSSQFGIRSIPALMMFKDGKVVAQKIGAAPKGDLAKWIQASA